jgi:integrase
MGRGQARGLKEQPVSIREREWKDAEGNVQTAWAIDVKMKVPGRGVVRVRQASPINTKRGAEQYEQRVRAALLHGTFQKEEIKPKTTFSQFLGRYLTYCANNNKFSTYETKKTLITNHLAPFFANTPLDSIGPAEIEAFKAEMKGKLSRANLRKDKPTKQAIQRRYGTAPKTVSAKTINNVLTVLSKMLSVAEEQGVIYQARRVRRFKVEKPPFDFLTFDEAERLVEACEAEWRPALLLALKAGLRLGEIRALQWSDVDLVRGVLIVRRNFWKDHLNETPKGGRNRTVDLPASLLAALKAHRHLKPTWVFSDAEGNPFSQKQLDRPLAKAIKASGIARDAGRIGWHDLRHTYGSHLAMRAVPLVTIQALLGHASIEQTMRYAHLSPEVKRDAVMVLDYPASAQVGAQAGHMNSGTAVTT